LGNTARQRRHGSDISTVRFPFKDDRIAHEVGPLTLMIPATTLGWLRGRHEAPRFAGSDSQVAPPSLAGFLPRCENPETVHGGADHHEQRLGAKDGESEADAGIALYPQLQ
jgi:hypothetical protein